MKCTNAFKAAKRAFRVLDELPAYGLKVFQERKDQSRIQLFEDEG